MKLDFLGNSNLSNCPCKNQSEMTDNHLVTAGTNCKEILRSLVIYLAGVGTGRKLGFLRDATSSIHVTVRFPLIQMRIKT